MKRIYALLSVLGFALPYYFFVPFVLENGLGLYGRSGLESIAQALRMPNSMEQKSIGDKGRRRVSKIKGGG